MQTSHIILHFHELDEEYSPCGAVFTAIVYTSLKAVKGHWKVPQLPSLNLSLHWTKYYFTSVRNKLEKNAHLYGHVNRASSPWFPLLFISIHILGARQHIFWSFSFHHRVVAQASLEGEGHEGLVCQVELGVVGPEARMEQVPASVLGYVLLVVWNLEFLTFLQLLDFIRICLYCHVHLHMPGTWLGVLVQ